MFLVEFLVKMSIFGQKCSRNRNSVNNWALVLKLYRKATTYSCLIHVKFQAHCSLISGVMDFWSWGAQYPIIEGNGWFAFFLFERARTQKFQSPQKSCNTAEMLRNPDIYWMLEQHFELFGRFSSFSIFDENFDFESTRLMWTTLY